LTLLSHEQRREINAQVSNGDLVLSQGNEKG